MNEDVGLYIQPSELSEAHEPARLLSEIEINGACEDATRRIRGRGYIFGFRDESPYWTFEFPANGRSRISVPHRPVLSIISVSANLGLGDGWEAQELSEFSIEDAAQGRIAAATGFFGNEAYPWQGGNDARSLREGNPAVAGLTPRVTWRIIYTGGKKLTADIKGVALKLAKIAADECRAVGMTPANTNFDKARDVVLSEFLGIVDP